MEPLSPKNCQAERLDYCPHSKQTMTATENMVFLHCCETVNIRDDESHWCCPEKEGSLFSELHLALLPMSGNMISWNFRAATLRD
jgi:hypothetical protein